MYLLLKPTEFSPQNPYRWKERPSSIKLFSALHSTLFHVPLLHHVQTWCSTREAEENLCALGQPKLQWHPHLQRPSLAWLRCYEMTLSTSTFMKSPRALLFGWYLSFLESIDCHLDHWVTDQNFYVQPLPLTALWIHLPSFLFFPPSATLSCFVLTFSIDHVNSVLLLHILVISLSKTGITILSQAMP